MYTPTKLEIYFLKLVNETRAKVGAKPLSFDGELLESSDAHSLWMGKTNIFSHTGEGGSTAGARMTSAGYEWQAWGENIAWRYGPLTEETIRGLHDQFVNSPGHYANLINGTFQEIGIGLQVGKGGVYVTQNFGSPNANERAEPNDVGTGRATTRGTSGKDMLYGSNEADDMYGGLGHDTYYVDHKNDRVFEQVGQGTDKVISSVTFSLGGQDLENLTLWGMGNISGTGNSLNNSIAGNSGRNTLKGSSGKDTLNGNGGKDVLWGGTGKDTFVFDTSAEADGDTIRDFTRGADRINLKNIDANAGQAGNQAFKFISEKDFHNVAGELRAFKSGATTYITGDTNGDGIADFTIMVSGLKAFASSDFIL
ncbi:Ca2+-binding RTX toxin-like protein [Microvirga lupini]|uniref:Ca2+-binding RTX toxin-like protein n=1 Tax=Microvirga lupini TaxID=420324 RepID=A0A7W4VPU2_9HYPH|nr:CAP domain-containing protein [Microvirga lupini]MBB3020672.1 Ca2+-binding RTX toxin-like protein [Microvirga lupini]